MKLKFRPASANFRLFLAVLCVGLAAVNFAQVNLSAAALCGAAAFLAINLNAPFTAFALAAGFCDINLGAYTAITLSVACAVGVRNLLSKQEKKETYE